MRISDWSSDVCSSDLAALQTVALKNSGGSASRTQAAIQIYSMMDIIRANRANIGIYNTNIYTEGDGTGADGTMMGWLDGLQATVAPDAKGRVVCIADTLTCSVGVQWSDERAPGGTSRSEERRLGKGWGRRGQSRWA